MLQSKPIARRWFLCSTLNIFALSVFWSGVVSAGPDADKLKLLASSAGRYAAWRDICGDPDGADIRSDFLARVELLAPEEQAVIIQHFEKRYTKKKKNGEKAVESCILQGKTDCCTVGPAGRIIGAKKLYDSHVASFAVAAVPAESSGSAAESAAPSAPPSKPVPTAATPVAAAAKPVPVAATAKPTATLDPSLGELTELAKSAGQYAAHNDVCGQPMGAAVKADYRAWVELLSEKMGPLANSRFDQNYKFKKQQTRPYNCPDTKHLAVLKKKYEYDMRVLGATSIPGGYTPSTSAEDVVAILAVAKNLPETSLAPGNLPDMRAYTAQMNRLAFLVAALIRSAKQCDDPVGALTKSQFLALIEPLSAQGQDKAMSWSELSGEAKPKKELKPGDRGYYPPKPCPRGILESGRANYEGILKLLAKVARTEYRTKQTGPAAGVATVADSKSSRIKRIRVEDFYSGIPTERVKAYQQAKLDAIIAECGGTRDTMIRENMKTFFRASLASQASWSSRSAPQKEQMAEQQMFKYDLQYEQTMAKIFKSGCGKVFIDRKPDTPELAYTSYLAYQDQLLDRSAKLQAGYACLELEKAYMQNAPGATRKAVDECQKAKYQTYVTAQER